MSRLTGTSGLTRQLTRWIPLAAVVVLLGAAMLAAAFANPTIETLPEGTFGTRTPPAPTTEAPLESATRSGPPAPSVGSFVPTWVGWLLAGLCIAVVLFVIGLLLWMLLRDRLANRPPKLAVELTQPPTPTETRSTLRAAVDEGIADLDDRDGDPRRAVIACWVRLERAAAEAGTPRAVGDTSTDLVARLLAAHEISGDVLAGLAAVYREARFATHTVDVTMRDQARTALVQLRDELAASHV